jgi:two-component system catabolic regulation response regulator CreB/two-component system response regulator ChvI
VAALYIDMNYASNITSLDYCYYSYNKFKTILSLGSHDPRYYDEMITKVNLQAREQQQQEQHLMMDETSTSNDERKRILLVDDEPDICMVYQIVLEDAWYQCTSYTDPVKALQEFKPDYYDLVLLDIKMPVLNGFELCKKIREIDESVHIVFITASEEYYKEFRNQHYPGLAKINYIQKPIGNDELVRLVNMIITISIINDFTTTRNNIKTS